MMILKEFDVEPGYTLTQLGIGLIHKTYAVSYNGKAAYILQRLNTDVFPRTEILEHNSRVVTECIERAVRARHGDVGREVLRFVPSAGGSLIASAEDKSRWRLSHYVSDSTTVNIARSADEAAAVARAFAEFLRDLWELPPDRVQDAIPGFHDTPRRYRRLRDIVDALESSGSNARLAAASDLIAKIRSRANLLGIIEAEKAAGRISTHVCHNDTKVNNVLLDVTTRRPLCVIDLDTIGPGSPLMDVGDLLRTAAATATEEERDLDEVAVDPPTADAIVAAFLEVLSGRLNEREQQLLPFAGWLITMEQAIRYLTDYLENDVYYGERYPRHNLRRAQNQLALALSMEHSIVDLATVR